MLVQAAAGHGGTAPPAAGQAAAVAGGQDVIKQAAEKAQDMVIELQGLCKAWFQRIRNGLEASPVLPFLQSLDFMPLRPSMTDRYPLCIQEPYDLEQARADQEKILSLFATLSEELRKSGERIIPPLVPLQ